MPTDDRERAEACIAKHMACEPEPYIVDTLLAFRREVLEEVRAKWATLSDYEWDVWLNAAIKEAGG